MKRKDHCIVIGASVAGTLTAYALAPFFRQVTIIEQSSHLGRLRSGLGQGSQIHIYLARGQRVLKELMPGIEADFHQQGFPLMSLPSEFAWKTDFGEIRSNNPNPWAQVFLMDRLALERCLLDRLQQRTNVSIRLATTFEDFTTDLRDHNGDHPRQVTGVVCKSLDGRRETLAADLCVMAGGRAMADRFCDSLRQLGTHLPEPEHVQSHFTYCSEVRHHPNPEGIDWKIRFRQPNPPQTFRGGMICKIHERGEYLFMTGWMNNRIKDVNIKDMSDFLGKLGDDQITSFYQQSTSIRKPMLYKITGSTHRHFGKADQWPKGLVAIGDVNCAFNPVYGQGLTVATLEVEAMLKEVANNGFRDGFEHNLQRQFDKITKMPWMFSTTEDRRIYSKGDTIMEKLAGAYVASYLKSSSHYPEIGEIFLQVNQMLKHPLAIFSPKIWPYLARSALRDLRQGKKV